MEPVWELSESVALDAEFSLLEGFGLQSAADAFIWSDFLGAPSWIGRHIEVSGKFVDGQSLKGKFVDGQSLEGEA